MKDAESARADLAMPPFPESLSYLWRIYHRLRRRTAMGFNGPNPVSWQDIQAFVERTRIDLLPWEIDILEAVDDAFLNPVLRATPAAPPSGPQMKNAADVSDTRGVRALLRSIGRKRKGG